jgi:hypothetical protein
MDLYLRRQNGWHPRLLRLQLLWRDHGPSPVGVLANDRSRSSLPLDREIVAALFRPMAAADDQGHSTPSRMINPPLHLRPMDLANMPGRSEAEPR